jgi:hypothetical protein
VIPVPDLVLYARPGCHLCEEAREATELVLAERARQGLPLPAFREVDIEGDRALHDALFERIPVVELGGRRLELIVSVSKLRRFLSDALDTETVAER